MTPTMSCRPIAQGEPWWWLALLASAVFTLDLVLTLRLRMQVVGRAFGASPEQSSRRIWALRLAGAALLCHVTAKIIDWTTGSGLNGWAWGVGLSLTIAFIGLGIAAGVLLMLDAQARADQKWRASHRGGAEGPDWLL